MADDDIVKQAAMRRERRTKGTRGGDDIFTDHPTTPMTIPRAPVTSPRTPVTSPRAPVTSPRTPVTSPMTQVTSPRTPVTSPRPPVTSPRQDVGGRRQHATPDSGANAELSEDGPKVDRDLLIPRRMNTHRRSYGNVEKTTSHAQKRPVTDAPCLPFIECQLNGKSVKALLNTCVMSSIINRHLYQHIFGSDENMMFMTDMATGVPITIERRTVQFDFHTRGDIPDVVLGLDFLTTFKCCLNLGDKTLSLGSVNDSDFVCTKLISDRELPLRYRMGTNLAASV